MPRCSRSNLQERFDFVDLLWIQAPVRASSAVHQLTPIAAPARTPVGASETLGEIRDFLNSPTSRADKGANSGFIALRNRYARSCHVCVHEPSGEDRRCRCPGSGHAIRGPGPTTSHTEPQPDSARPAGIGAADSARSASIGAASAVGSAGDHSTGRADSASPGGGADGQSQRATGRPDESEPGSTGRSRFIWDHRWAAHANSGSHAAATIAVVAAAAVPGHPGHAGGLQDPNFYAGNRPVQDLSALVAGNFKDTKYKWYGFVRLDGIYDFRPMAAPTAS